MAAILSGRCTAIVTDLPFEPELVDHFAAASLQLIDFHKIPLPTP